MEKRNYELMFIVNTELGDEERESLLERIQAYLDRAQAEVYSFKSWGLRRLAYTIAGQREGHYYLVQFAALPESISTFERSLSLAEGVLRQMITVLVGEPNTETETETVVDEPATIVEPEVVEETVVEPEAVEETVEEPNQPEEPETAEA